MNFVKEFYKNPRRGYGGGVIDVFRKLRDSRCKEPLRPAREQFNGNGSYGNGGAMRVAPIALFYHNASIQDVAEMARKSAEITHTHREGVDGTILQALAIHQALNVQTDTELDAQQFVAELQRKMSSIENGDEFDDAQPYGQKLKEISRLLSIQPSDEQIQNVLGTDVSALRSVPTAIYCFLRGHRDITDIQSTNPFRRSLEFAIRLGGDTDTIASMTGAICGAYYGDSLLSETLLKHCEGSAEIRELADKLYEASCSK